MSFTDQIEKIQKKPYESRLKILWSVVAICAVVLLVLWIFNIKNTFQNLDGKSLLKSQPTVSGATPEIKIPIVGVERVETKNNELLIYFNFDNQTDEILSVPKLEDIKLTYNDQVLNPSKITNRQNEPIVQKVLSKTQVFGILTFAKANTEEATLTFDHMFFESNTSQMFKQTLELDLTKLNSNGKLRN